MRRKASKIGLQSWLKRGGKFLNPKELCAQKGGEKWVVFPLGDWAPKVMGRPARLMDAKQKKWRGKFRRSKQNGRRGSEWSSLLVIELQKWWGDQQSGWMQSKRNEEGSFAGRNKMGDEEVSGLPSWWLNSESGGRPARRLQAGGTKEGSTWAVSIKWVCTGLVETNHLYYCTGW